MTLPVQLTAAAQSDLSRAREWYLDEAPHMCDAFEWEIAVFLDRIGERPKMYQAVEASTRRAVMDRFPFSVYYQVLPRWVEVIAVLHQARDPRVWRQRLR